MITLKRREDESIVIKLDNHKVIIKLSEIDEESTAAKLDVQADEEIRITHNFTQLEYVD